MSENNSKIVLSLVIRTFLQEIQTSSDDLCQRKELSLAFPAAHMTVLVTGLCCHPAHLLYPPLLMATRTFNYLYQVEKLQQERLRHIACTCSSTRILHINKNFKSFTLLGHRIIFCPVLCIMWRKRKENGHSICKSVFQLFHCSL